MASDPNAHEVMEWRQEEGGGQDELSQATAPSVETDSTRLARLHPGGAAPWSPTLPIGFFVKERSKRPRGSKTPAATCDPVTTGRIDRLDTILGHFDRPLKES